MLDVITDFWKPTKKNQSQEKLQPERLEIGSQLGFGFVPQSSLNGRRVQISAINTYQFGDEALTSFVLSQDKDHDASMIVAEAEGEQYLAISRRLSISERMKLFDSKDLEAAVDKAEFTKLVCRESLPEFKGWTVGSYKREIQGLDGRLFRGDYRKSPLPSASQAQQFEYSLLVSESNEHAIEIEKYTDGRIEVYATIYRRLGDIGEVTYQQGAPDVARSDVGRPDIKLASRPDASRPDSKPVLVASDTGAAAPAPEAAMPMAVSVAPVQPRPEPIKLPELTPAAAQPPKQETPAKPVPAMMAAESKAEAPKAEAPKPETPIQKEKPMAMIEMNGTRNDTMNATSDNDKSRLYVQPTAPEGYMKQEVKAVQNKAMSNFDADAIECDLRVANKIIDEAIRNEMRLTDIVRRVIELPVAYPESVQIPLSLTDEDYALLGIRYGISSSDRSNIKRRIIEDLNDFSGGKKKAAA